MIQTRLSQTEPILVESTSLREEVKMQEHLDHDTDITFAKTIDTREHQADTQVRGDMMGAFGKSKLDQRPFHYPNALTELDSSLGMEKQKPRGTGEKLR